MTLDLEVTRLQDFAVVPIAGRQFQVLRSVNVRATDQPGLPYDLRLTIELADGRFGCTSLEVHQRPGGPPVTLAGIRSLPVGSLVLDSVKAHVVPVLKVEQTSPGNVKMTMGPFVYPIPRRRRTRGRRAPGEDVDDAAITYGIAQMCGEPPTKAVADSLRIPLGTARELVARAREAGLLPPAS